MENNGYERNQYEGAAHRGYEDVFLIIIMFYHCELYQGKLSLLANTSVDMNTLAVWASDALSKCIGLI